MTASNAALEQSQYLSFFLAGEEFGIGILKVKEILEYGAVTRVPTTPPWIRGVINLRGSVVPVVDLAVKFGLAQSAVTRWSCIVIVETELEGESTVMGVVADAVSQVIDLTSADIEPPPAFGSRVRVEFLLGMGKLDQKFVLLLDIDKLLSTSELVTVATAAVEPSAAEARGPEVAQGEAATA
jgi:purine-binding chemotaxis protein CheW